MPNVQAVTDKVARDMPLLFKNNTILASKVNRQFDKEFVASSGKIGYTLRVRQPNKFSVNTGATFSATDIADPTTLITVQGQKHVDFLLSYADLTMNTEDLTKRYVMPAMQTLAAQADLEGFLLYKKIANLVGTPGTAPTAANAASILMDANAKITNQSAPTNDRHLIVSPNLQVGLIDGMKGLFNNQSIIGKQFKNGAFAEGILGYDDISMAQSVATHTVGALGGTPQVDAAQGASSGASYQEGTLNVKGASNSIAGWAKAGDVVTINGVYDVNPLTKATLSNLKQFVVTADADSSGTGIVALSIAPAILYGGPYQTCSDQAANSATITISTGTTKLKSQQALAFHGDALTFVMADLDMPTSGVIAASRMSVDDYSFRMLAYYNGDEDQFRVRIDGLWGWAALRPEWATRVAF